MTTLYHNVEMSRTWYIGDNDEEVEIDVVDFLEILSEAEQLKIITKNPDGTTEIEVWHRPTVN